MGKLEIPQNINAEALIKKATKFGHCFIDQDTQAEIFNAEKEITKAQGDVRNADGEVTSAEGKQQSAEAQSEEAQSKKDASENKSQAAPTVESVEAQGTEAESIMTASQGRRQTMTEALSSVAQSGSVFSGLLDAGMTRMEGLCVEIGSIQQENDALIAENQALMEQLAQENTFDGTGSGTSSAYSLSTGVEIEEQQAAQEAQGQSDNSTQAQIDSNNARIDANGARVQELDMQTQTEQQSIDGARTTAETELQQQQSDAEAAQAENDSSNDRLQRIGQYAETATNIGGTIDAVGDVVKVAGTAVLTAGGILTATGTAVGVTGGALTTTGAIITGIGAPLCALFGIGVPIVGAGGATTGSGVGVTATGATVGGTGGSLVTAGNTIRKVGEGISIGGNALKAIGSGTTAYVRAAQGDVAGSIQATMTAISSITSAVASVGGSSQKTASIVNRVANGAAAVQSGISAYRSAQNGDITGAITNGISSLAYGTAGAFGGRSVEIAQKVSNGTRAASSVIASVNSFKNDDIRGGVLNGLSAIGFAYSTGGKSYTEAASHFSNALSETSQALQDFDEGDEINGRLNLASAILHGISGVGSAGTESVQRRSDRIVAGNVEKLETIERERAEARARRIEEIKAARGQEVVGKIDPKGRMDAEFRDGLAEIVGESAVIQQENAANGEDALTGLNKNNSGVTDYGVFGQHAKVKEMGLEEDVSLVQDAQQLAATGYSGEYDADGNFVQHTHRAWTEVSSVDGITYKDGKPVSDGFHAKAFERNGGDEILVVFRGSDDASDLTSDRQMLQGQAPEQLDNALDYVRQIREEYPNAKIIITGHSLGGALTELVASDMPDVLGISFNAVGTQRIVENTEGLQDNHNTINYIIQGDEISNASRHVGSTVVMKPNGNPRHTEHAIQQFGGNAFDGVEAGMVKHNTTEAGVRLTLECAIRLSGESGNRVTFTDEEFKAILKEFKYDVNTYGADLDELRDQIRHVADNDQRVALLQVLKTRRREIEQADLTGLQQQVTGVEPSGDIDEAVTSSAHVTEEMSSRQVNRLLRRKYGFREPAFGDTPAAKVVFDREVTMVRVFNDESSFARGSWLMAYDDIAGLTPEQIKDKFALPALPKYVAEVRVPAGAEMITGSCRPVEGWGNGGGTQYFVTGGNRPVQYGNMRKLPGVE